MKSTNETFQCDALVGVTFQRQTSHRAARKSQTVEPESVKHESKGYGKPPLLLRLCCKSPLWLSLGGGGGRLFSIKVKIEIEARADLPLDNSSKGKLLPSPVLSTS